MKTRNDRPSLFSVCLIAVVGLTLPGCASGGAGQTGAARSNYGALPFIQPRTTVTPKASGPIVRPGPGPALPDAGGDKWPSLYPGSAGLYHQRGPRQPGLLPRVTPRPVPDSPVAAHPAPATLSGGIEIVPGPSIRERRSRMESLPSPLSDKSESQIQVVPSPVGRRFEELPPPE